MTRVFIGFGSNLANPIHQIQRAHAQLCNTLRCVACSDLYENPPVGPQDQPNYVNGVCCYQTSLAPMPLLRLLQNIENNQGRMRGSERWQARTLDLDLLLYGEENIDIPELQIPHPRLYERAFVLYPLQQIDAELDIPGYGRLGRLLAQLDEGAVESLIKIAEF